MLPAPTLLVLALAFPPAAAEVPVGTVEDRIQELSARIDLCEERFQDSLRDLAAIDVCSSARRLDDELRIIESEAISMEAGGLDPKQQRDLELGVLEPLRFARYRMIDVEHIGTAAGYLSGLLTDLRSARRAGHPMRALALYDALDPSRHVDGHTPALLRRQLEAIETERMRARAELETFPGQARPR